MKNYYLNTGFAAFFRFITAILRTLSLDRPSDILFIFPLKHLMYYIYILKLSRLTLSTLILKYPKKSLKEQNKYFTF